MGGFPMGIEWLVIVLLSAVIIFLLTRPRSGRSQPSQRRRSDELDDLDDVDDDLVAKAPRRPAGPRARPRPEAAVEQPAQMAAVFSPPRKTVVGKPAPDILELQPQFADYEFLELIGQGGMGAVYRVRRRSDGEIFALKLVSGNGEQGEAFAARFLREAEALERLSHPNIVSIRGHGRTGEWCWVLMDLIEGANLRQVQATGRFSPSQALALVSPLCSALQYAHDRGVVHRDLKPENILIDDKGQPHLVDFGLAKLHKPISGDSLTVTGEVMGSMHYMAPEQVEGARAVDHRADIYALGVILYELLTGRLPLGRFEPPSQKVAVDVRIDEVVLRALERDPQRRWQQASHVTDAVSAARAQPKSAAQRRQPAARHDEFDEYFDDDREEIPDSPRADRYRPWGMELNSFLMLMHLSQFAGYILAGAGFILPLVMWLTCRDRDGRIDVHGKIIGNWIISSIIYGIVSVILCMVLIGIPLLIALCVVAIIFPIVGAVRANDGQAWDYPCSIRFFDTRRSTEGRTYVSTGGGAGCAVALLVGLAIIVGLVVLGFLYTLGAQSSSHIMVNGHSVRF
jgi:serine/threonine protein kinase